MRNRAACRPRCSAIALAGCAAWVACCASCGSVQHRSPPPQELAESLAISGIPDARSWGDRGSPYVEAWLQRSKDEVRASFSGVCDREHTYLALSGGGAEGAFGAGLLAGWTAAGTRPEFTLVTGISTGALTAPFAFLGPDYDDELKAVYTTTKTKDLLDRRSKLRALSGDSFYDTAKLKALIDRYITSEVLDAIAREHRRGRGLHVATTNLDAMRPVIWNLGRIAVSGHPRALELVRKVLLASASIPIAFPPVLFDVVAPDGRAFDELHVDGGATAQVFLYPLGIDWAAVTEKLGVLGKPKVFAIYNGQVEPRWKAIDPPGLFEIIDPTMSAMIRTQGIGDLYRMYLGAQRDELDYHLAFIPADFAEVPGEMFDPVYMRKLFDRGYELAKAGYAWARVPPGLSEESALAPR